ncbi:MAG TPA: glycosyltransferase family 4 protein [Dehalococcoidia bacterium]|nr:glycosyltransferase family 4 protein [Dehalococcoidia bacterium]
MGNRQKNLLVTGFAGLGDDGKTTHLLEVWGNISKTNRVKMILPRPRAKARVSEEYKEQLQNIELHFAPFTTPRKSNLGAQAITLLLYEIWVSFYLLISKPSLVYARTPWLGLVTLPARLKRIPLIIEVNGIAATELLLFSKSRLVGLLARIFALVERVSYSRATGIVTVTERLKDYLVEKYGLNPRKIWVIGNGVNVNLFQPLEQQQAKDLLSLEADYHYVTFVGELSPEQGVEHVIEAAPLILSQVPRTKFLIVGDGSERVKWSNMVSRLNLDDAFIFTGRVPYQKVPLFINAGDVCAALIRRKENAFSSVKMHEYMSCGRPIVAANNLAFGILEEYQTGFLVDPESPEQVAEAITKLLENKELAEEMGRRGRKYVVENRSWESAAQKVSQVCHEVTQ